MPRIRCIDAEVGLQLLFSFRPARRSPVLPGIAAALAEADQRERAPTLGLAGSARLICARSVGLHDAPCGRPLVLAARDHHRAKLITTLQPAVMPGIPATG
jgi:hypothetical protein